MATLAARQEIIAAFNIMIAARLGEKIHAPFTPEEIVDILTAMAEADGMAAQPRPERRNNRYWAPAESV